MKHTVRTHLVRAHANTNTITYHDDMNIHLRTIDFSIFAIVKWNQQNPYHRQNFSNCDAITNSIENPLSINKNIRLNRSFHYFHCRLFCVETLSGLQNAALC